MENNIKSCSLRYVSYNPEVFTEIDTNQEIHLKNSSQQTEWLSLVGNNTYDTAKEIIINNNLDDFLLKLLNDKSHRIRIIELENSFFLSVNLFYIGKDKIKKERIIFIVTPYLVCNIQKQNLVSFEPVLERIKNNQGIIRRKKADYLLFGLVELIFDKYKEEYEKMVKRNTELNKGSANIDNSDFVRQAEELKQLFLLFKNSIKSFRDAFASISNLELKDFNEQYFSEVKEQANFLIEDLDFELNLLDSNISLYFSMQDHQLNQVMRTLTIISVIFIPITFLAGLYGMNFKYMPELDMRYGYPILILSMIIIVVISLNYFKRKKWF